MLECGPLNSSWVFSLPEVTPPLANDSRIQSRLAPYFSSDISMPTVDFNGRPETRNFRLPICSDIYFVYAVLGESCPNENTRGAVGVPYYDSFFLAWKSECKSPDLIKGINYLFVPGGSWASGRNSLHQAIHAKELDRGCLYLYHMYADDDTVLLRLGQYDGSNGLDRR